MQRIWIERRTTRDRRDRYAVLPLDPRDPDILRAKRRPLAPSSSKPPPAS
jgi:hypothetical protein